MSGRDVPPAPPPPTPGNRLGPVPEQIVFRLPGLHDAASNHGPLRAVGDAVATNQVTPARRRRLPFTRLGVVVGREGSRGGPHHQARPGMGADDRRWRYQEVNSDSDEDALWCTYTTLTDVEAVFRSRRPSSTPAPPTRTRRLQTCTTRT